MDVRNPGLAARAVRRELATRRQHGVTLMATAPTVALSAANGATSISGATLRAPSGVGTDNAAISFTADPCFAYAGTPSLAASTGVNNAYATSPVFTGSTASARYAPATRFRFYGDKFEIVFKALTSSYWYRLRVDGQWASYECQYLSGLTVGAVYRVLVTFASVGPRHIQLDWPGYGFAGIAAAPAHSVTRPLDSADIPTIVMGDSITASANPGSAAGSVRGDTWINYTADIMGWRDLRNAAIAGTGYVNAGTDAAFKDRLADLAIPGARYVLYGGLNDTAGTAFNSAVDTVLAQIVSMTPTEVLVMGCHAPNGDAYASTTKQAINAALQAKAAQWGATFIDTLAQTTGAPKWVTGNGNSTTPNASGTADLFVNADNTHPTRAGHQHLGYVRADQVVAAMSPLAA